MNTINNNNTTPIPERDQIGYDMIEAVDDAMQRKLTRLYNIDDATALDKRDFIDKQTIRVDIAGVGYDTNGTQGFRVVATRDNDGCWRGTAMNNNERMFGRINAMRSNAVFYRCAFVAKQKGCRTWNGRLYAQRLRDGKWFRYC